MQLVHALFTEFSVFRQAHPYDGNHHYNIITNASLVIWKTER